MATYGNDTITGLAAGGLPDDSITNAELADDAVQAAQLADDAVVQAAIADDAVDEARLQISNAGSNGEYLQKQSGNTGGLTWAAVTTSPTTTRGDVIYRGASADERLAKGSSGQVLTMGANDPAWAAAAGGEVRGWATYQNSSESTTTTVNSFQDSNFSSTNYAPTATDSVLIVSIYPKLSHHEGYGTYSSDHRYRLMFRIQREIGGNGTWTTVGNQYGHDAAGGGYFWACDVRHEEGGGGLFHRRDGMGTVVIADSPNTTSNVKYKIQYCAGLSGQSVGISSGGPSYMTLLEVAP